VAGEAVVVGGGVIGVAAAHYLHLAGWQVTLVDRGEVGRGCSYANACLIVPSHAVPLPGPGVLAQAVRWLVRPDSPIYVRPHLDAEFLGWSRRFLRACSAPAAQSGTEALQRAAAASVALFDELVTAWRLEFGYRRQGTLNVYVTEAGFARAGHEQERLQRCGLRARVLSREETLAFEPALGPRIAGALFVEGDAHGDSYAYVQALAASLQSRGVRLLTGTAVVRVQVRAGRVEGVVTEGREQRVRADLVVLAAGAWTPQLLAPLGLRLPLQPAKGYSCTIPGSGCAPAVPVFVDERRVAITPLRDRLRIGGTLELAGYRPGINPRRYRAVVRAAQEALAKPPEADRGEAWMGYRPLVADGLPVIDRVPGADGLIVAAGHGTLGFTLSPITGRLVADLAEGRPPAVPLEPFRLSRF